MMCNHRVSLLFAAFTLLSLSAGVALSAAPKSNELGPVDFRYALPWWQTAICLPDDPDKTLVGKEGQILFDYGYHNGYRDFAISLQPDPASGTKWVRQETLSARAPIVETRKESGAIKIVEQTFVVVPTQEKPADATKIERLDGDGRELNWAKPGKACPAAFADIMLAMNGELRYRLSVPAGGRMTLVFGLCEGWHKEAGKRPLVLSAEGAASQTVDPVKDFGANQPGCYRLQAKDENHDGFIDITVGTPKDSPDRNAILNALWAFQGDTPDGETLLAKPAAAYAFLSAAMAMPERRVIVLITLQNTGSAVVACRPTLHISSTLPVTFSAQDGVVMIGGTTRLTAAEGIDFCQIKSNADALVSLAPINLGAKASAQVAYIIDRNTATSSAPGGAGPGARASLSVVQAHQLRNAARDWWEKLDLPYQAVQIPDAGIQEMIESSIRNIWQAREIKQGKIAFHVGPTCYRGLWIVDGSFLLESAAILGRGQDARSGIEYMLGKQKPDGGFELMARYWKENGIVLWAATRHALLMQDQEWLRSKWPALRRVVDNTKALRAMASKDPKALDYRLLPAGFIDGGLVGEGKPEYSNIEWNLVGLKAAVAAAQWLDEKDDAIAWQKEYDDFYAAFRQAAARDMLKDRFGNAYLPTMMDNAGNFTPQKGQWSFCHAIYPGQIFAIDDPLAQGQMAMLRATKVEGMVCDTGWMQDGLWNYFASFYGHAALWMGHGDEAAEVLYDFANHAAPTRVWREEQKPLGKGNDEVGDMPHNWASAEFIRLAVHLLEIDRGDELHLLEGMPAAWLKPGMATRLNGVATPFGPLTMAVAAAADGKTARLEIKPLAANCKAVVVHIPDGSTQRISPTEGGAINFPIQEK
jgi:hypothetical protein